jgi:Cu/Ag efflux protein CusF
MNGFMRKIATAAFAAALTATAALAQGAAIDAEVKKIDESAAKITLKHGPAKSLGMDEPMTMVYRVKDPAMLKQVKVGDKVKFEAEEAASGYTVTKLQKSK